MKLGNGFNWIRLGDVETFLFIGSIEPPDTKFMDVALQNKVILKLMEFSVTPFKLIASSLKLYSPTLEKSWVPTLIT
jgi:hypothetical protein